jgi:hypothetical protein
MLMLQLAHLRLIFSKSGDQVLWKSGSLEVLQFCKNQNRLFRILSVSGVLMFQDSKFSFSLLTTMCFWRLAFSGLCLSPGAFHVLSYKTNFFPAIDDNTLNGQFELGLGG